jgi:hypothetical protein
MHFQDDPNPPPYIEALAEVRHLATGEGWCSEPTPCLHPALPDEGRGFRWVRQNQTTKERPDPRVSATGSTDRRSKKKEKQTTKPITSGWKW